MKNKRSSLNFIRTRLLVLSLGLAGAGISPSAHAANDLWIGNTNANFNTLTNWTGSVNPNGNTPEFGTAGSSGTTLNNDQTGSSFAGLTFDSGASAFTIGGNSFTLTGNITNNGANTQKIKNDMTISATRTVTATSGQLVLGGSITGAAGLTLNPTNKITLAGTNNFGTGGSFSNLTVNAGAGGVDITGSTTVGNGGATNANGYISFGGNVTVTIQSGGSLTSNGSTASTPSSAIGQNIAGTSTLLVNGGTFTFGPNNSLLIGNGSTGTGVLTIASGTATINRGSLATTNGASADTRMIMLGRDPTSAGGNTGIINLNGGTLATGSQFVRDGSSAASSGIANFVFGGGTLKALGNQTDWLQSTTASSEGQNQGATGGTVNTAALALSSVTTTAVSTIDSNSYSVAINSAISGAGGFNINSSTGTGVVTLGGANTYFGNTTVTSGTLSVARAGTAGTPGSGTLGATAITVSTNGTLLVSAANAIGTGSSVTLSGGTFKVNGAFSEGTGAHVTGATYNSSTRTATGGTVASGANVQGMGNLTLTAASTLDFGASKNTQVFGAFDPTNSGAGNFTLNVINYSSTATAAAGVSGTDTTNDRLIFNQGLTTGLTTAQLADISFNGVFDAAQIQLGDSSSTYFEVEAVPEPTTIFAGLLIVGFLGMRERRRLRELYRRIASKKV